jgi:hypothetical protein
MGRTVIAAVGTIANWAIYSSPLLPWITKSCGGILRIFTGESLLWSALGLSNCHIRLPSLRLPSLRWAILFPRLCPEKETNRTTDTGPSERNVLRGGAVEMKPSFVLGGNLL